jgi:hypothetical protein
MSAIIFQIPNADKVLILDSRQALIYPFTAPNWLDLRFGAFISLTRLTDNNDPTTLAETLTTTGLQTDRVWMGLKKTDQYGPRNSAFFGLSNSAIAEAGTSSIVEAGDVAQRWRYKGIANKAIVLNDGTTLQDNAGTVFGPEMNAESTPSVNPGRASLFMLRMVRTSGTSSTVGNFYYVKTTRVSDYADANVFTDNPTIGLIRSNLKSATWTSVLAPATFLTVPPDCVYFYWPFSNSRLRIHSIVVEKFS